MSDKFDEVFGARRPNFAERVGRTEPQNSPPSPEATAGSGPYKPYGYLPASIGESCEICRWTPGTEQPEGIEFQYRFLMQIGFVGDEEIKLFLPDCIVVIEGKQLRDLRKLLARRKVTFVQEFSTRVWRASPPIDGTVIERIDLVRPHLVNGMA